MKRRSIFAKHSAGKTSSNGVGKARKKSASSLVVQRTTKRLQLHIPRQAAKHVWGFGREVNTPLSLFAATALTLGLADLSRVCDFWREQLTNKKPWPAYDGHYSAKVVLPKVLRVDLRIDRVNVKWLEEAAESIGQTVPELGGAIIAAFCAAPQFAPLRKKLSRSPLLMDIL